MNGGPLTDMVGPGKAWKESHIAYVCKQMLMALAFLHRSHRLHRGQSLPAHATNSNSSLTIHFLARSIRTDIKSDNVLVDFNGDVKLGKAFTSHLFAERLLAWSTVKLSCKEYRNHTHGVCHVMCLQLTLALRLGSRKRSHATPTLGTGRHPYTLCRTRPYPSHALPSTRAAR